MLEFETSRLDAYVPDIKDKEDIELIFLELGKKNSVNNYVLIFFKDNKAKVINKNGKKIDYYIFCHRNQFLNFCKKIDNMDFFYTKTVNNKPVLFLNELLGIDHYQFKNIFYNEKNIRFILSQLQKQIKFNLNYHKTVFSKAINDAQRANKKRYKLKNEIDSFFGFFNNNAYKDVFIFKELRKNRKIVVLDINSMYPYLLTLKRYPHPATLKKIEIENISELEKFPFFLVKAAVKIKDNLSKEDEEFIRNFHGIEYRINNYTVPIKLSRDYKIITYFLKEEYEFYKKFLDFELKDNYAIISNSELDESALAKIVREIYPKRLKSKEAKKEDERYEVIDTVLKNYLVALPSAFSQNSSAIFEKYFKNENAFKEFIKKKLGFIVRDKEYLSKPISIYNQKYVSIPNTNQKVYYVKYKAFTYKYKDNLIHHHSIMFANARILMLNYFYELYSVKDKFNLEIAYSNIDSMHISIDADKLDEFLNFLKERGLISDELGKLKVEAIADYGIWYEVGTYYLFDKDFNVIKYANPLPKSKKKPFQVVCAIKDYDEFGYEFYRKYSLFKSFRYIKKLKKIDNDFEKWERINLLEYPTFDKISSFVKENIIFLYPYFRDVFFAIKRKNQKNSQNN